MSLSISQIIQSVYTLHDVPPACSYTFSGAEAIKRGCGQHTGAELSITKICHSRQSSAMINAALLLTIR